MRLLTALTLLLILDALVSCSPLFLWAVDGAFGVSTVFADFTLRIGNGKHASVQERSTSRLDGN